MHNPQYPALQALRAGRQHPGALRQDVLGRMAYRVDQESDRAPDYREDRYGGRPKARGPETYLPQVREAAQRLGMDPSVAGRRDVLARIVNVPNSPGGMFNINDADARAYLPETGGRRSSDPVVQAMAGLRKLRARNAL